MFLDMLMRIDIRCA